MQKLRKKLGSVNSLSKGYEHECRGSTREKGKDLRIPLTKHVLKSSSLNRIRGFWNTRKERLHRGKGPNGDMDYAMFTYLSSKPAVDE